MHKCHINIFTFIFFLALLLLPARAPARDLVRDGRPLAEIVIAEEPARMTRLAASELQTYIEKISGATLPIVTEPSGGAARILVGVSPHTAALGLDTAGLKYGAYRMASGPDWLALLGPDNDFEPVEPWARSRDRRERARLNAVWDGITGRISRNPFHSMFMWYNADLDVWLFDDRGTLHAVHAFLHDLGVRWYFPGALGEIVPQTADIPLPPDLSRTVKPEFPVRSITWWSKHHGMSRDDALWRLRLGLHLGHDVMGATQVCHGMKYVTSREELRREHPEYFALVAGQRVFDHKGAGAPCLSSEPLFEAHVAYVRAVLDHYGEPMLSIDMVDGFSGQACGCADCLKQRTPERGALGAQSDYVWAYVNRVAAEVYKTHPDRMLSGLSYGAYSLPPLAIGRLSPNLAVILMSSRQQFYLPDHREYFTALIRDWRAILPSDTFFTFENITYNRGSIPVYFTHQSADFLRAVGPALQGHHYESYEHQPAMRDKLDWHSLAVSHLDLYILSRLWWDSSIDVDALVDEYCRLFYGPAQTGMREFIDYCAEHHPRMRTDVAAIDRALELFAAARSAAEADGIYGRRLALTATYLERLHELRAQLMRPREGPELRLPRRAAADVKLDGRLDDPFWEGLPSVALRDLKTGALPPVATTVRMAWGDNNSLYVGIHCEEPDPDGMLNTADGTLGIFNGDNIDILIETPIVDFYQITLSPFGDLLDMDRSNPGRLRFNIDWNSGISHAIHRGQDYWSVEIQIPAGGVVARDLDPDHYVAGNTPAADAPWYFNLGRNRPRAGSPDAFAAYVPTGERHFHNRFVRGRLTVE